MCSINGFRIVTLKQNSILIIEKYYNSWISTFSEISFNKIAIFMFTQGKIGVICRKLKRELYFIELKNKLSRIYYNCLSFNHKFKGKIVFINDEVNIFQIDFKQKRVFPIIYNSTHCGISIL